MLQEFLSKLCVLLQKMATDLRTTNAFIGGNGLQVIDKTFTLLSIDTFWVSRNIYGIWYFIADIRPHYALDSVIEGSSRVSFDLLDQQSVMNSTLDRRSW